LFVNPITTYEVTLKATSHTTTTSATKPFIYSTIRWSIRTPYTPTYRRLIAEANAAAGKKWDVMLEKIMESDKIASAIRKNDLYNLANVGINDDWSVEAGMQIFARKTKEAEADGWMRAGAPARL
jgi:hypothetical protein